MSFETKTPIQKHVKSYSHWVPSDELTGSTDQLLQMHHDLIGTRDVEQETTSHSNSQVQFLCRDYAQF